SRWPAGRGRSGSSPRTTVPSHGWWWPGHGGSCAASTTPPTWSSPGTDRRRLTQVGSLPLEGQGRCRVRRVDLPGEAVPVEDRLRQQPGRDRVTDPVHRPDPGGLEGRRVTGQFSVQPVLGGLLGNQHHAVTVGRPGVAVAVVAPDLPGDDLGDRG